MPPMNVDNSQAEAAWSAVVETTLQEVDALMVAIRFSGISLEARAALAVDVMEMRRALRLEKFQLTRKDN